MPEIEFRENSFDDAWLWAVMSFPSSSDETMRNAYYFVRWAESEWENSKDAPAIEIEPETLRQLIDAPSKAELLKVTGIQQKQAVIVGDYLISLYAMNSFPEHFEEASDRKAVFATRQYAQRTAYSDGTKLKTSDTTIRKYIKRFKQVAHLWAALRLQESYFRPREETLMSPEAITEFLRIAATLQEFGCGFVPETPEFGKPFGKPVLDRTTIWSVPASTKPLAPPWTQPPTWLIKALAKYEAPKYMN